MIVTKQVISKEQFSKYINIIDKGELQDTLDNCTNILMCIYSLIMFGNDKYSNNLGVSPLNGIKVHRLKYPESKITYSFWAGTSGCNWNLNDSTGGNHDISGIKTERVVVTIPSSWVEAYNSLNIE